MNNLASHSQTVNNILLYAKPAVRMAQKMVSPLVKAGESKVYTASQCVEQQAQIEYYEADAAKMLHSPRNVLHHNYYPRPRRPRQKC